MIQQFTHITAVPQYKDLIDIAFSKTNRKTPTVVRAKFQIHRIRSFYFRKVKFSANEFINRLNNILQEFPVLEDIHPFYSDLIGILYDRDHYKIALGSVNSTKHRVETICKEHMKLINFGDSLYRCKELKRAALGKMATAIKKLSEPLKYLEEVRQHMSRLPAIDTAARTILVCGCPNVGKSSFMNAISQANVEVQSYAFTTKSIYVGHFEHNNLRWQVLDTPGILDRVLSERNSVEMLTITALAHLKAAVLFLIDPSETCGFSIEEQLSLYDNLTPLLRSKILTVFTKSDISRVQDIQNESLSAFLSNKKYSEMSVETGCNVEDVKNTICKMLLEERVSEKQSKISNFIQRIKPVVPSGPLNPRCEDVAVGTNCFLGVHENEAYFSSEKYDIIPEIYNGKNVADFIDPEIKEELEKVSSVEYNLREYDILSKEERELLEECNNARINAAIRSQASRRVGVPAGWKNKVTSRGELVSEINRAVPVKKMEPVHVDKRVSRSENKRYFDMQPKHIFRPRSTKHGKLKKN